jgi:hypothetical protein
MIRLIKLWDKINYSIRKPRRLKTPPPGLKVITVDDYSQLSSALAKIKIKPGWSVFF